jgi:hypothetical protein
MAWTEAQRGEVDQEYKRIGYVAGERWPAPPCELTPAEIVELLRRVPSGSGRAGYIAVVESSAKPK